MSALILYSNDYDHGKVAAASVTPVAPATTFVVQQLAPISPLEITNTVQNITSPEYAGKCIQGLLSVIKGYRQLLGTR